MVPYVPPTEKARERPFWLLSCGVFGSILVERGGRVKKFLADWLNVDEVMRKDVGGIPVAVLEATLDVI